MIIPETDLTPLDPRFPIAMTGTIPVFGALLAGWEDRVTVIEQARRAGEQAMRREERYVTPAPQPRFVPADTIVDFRVPGGDRFAREDQVTAEDVARWRAQRDAAAAGDTDTIIAIIDQAEAEEQAREERSVLRRLWRWARGRTA